MTKVFIDGSAGTTGLRIFDRLSERKDIELITLEEKYRKSEQARKQAINSSDISFLCLPDAAAQQAAGFVENGSTAVIDTSTAHRTNRDWTYGFSEIGDLKQKIAASKKIANAGCHASGFIALVAPLTENGLIDKSERLTCFSVTGYSGGGKKMIADYENEEKDSLLLTPGMYSLAQTHKHLPEMSYICSLENYPVFCPVVAPFYSGMQVTVSLFGSQIKGGINDIKELYGSYYRKGLVKYVQSDENGFLYSGKMQGKDSMEISVFGNEERITLVSRFDNLGKGASGNAIQNMNILLGLEESYGLII